MALTKEGADKIAAGKRGMQLAEYRQKIVAEKWCTKGKHWQPRTFFCSDVSRADGLAARCHGCSRVNRPHISQMGRPSAFKGKSHTAEAKALMRAKAVGRKSPMQGRKHTPETIEVLRKIGRERTPRGQNHYAYIDGRKTRHQNTRRSPEYKEWRLAVFTRDGFTCQDCGDKKGGNLAAHHLQSFADYPSLRFEVSNGLTLCKNCHESRHLKPALVSKCRRKNHAPPSLLL